MRERVELLSISHIGNSRDDYEDNYLVQKGVYLHPEVRDDMAAERVAHLIHEEAPADRFLTAISDGMGGHAHGEEASVLAIRYLSEHYDEIVDGMSTDEETLLKHVSRINDAVQTLSKGHEALRDMGATLCGVVSTERGLFGFNVGDSRLYSYTDGRLIQLSTDHTEGQRLVNMGLLTAEEVKNFPRRKVLHKCIGYDGNLIPDVFEIPSMGEGSVLMLCTDGLTDVVPEEEIERILSSDTSLEDKAYILVNEAITSDIGHGDNVTIVLIVF